MLNVFGGKITTYRRLAESALEKIAVFFPDLPDKWTAGVALPGRDFPVDGVADLIAALKSEFPFLDNFWAKRLIKAYGTLAREVLAGAKTADDLGQDFGASLTEQEVRWLMANEYVMTAEDLIWRRSKLGLRMSEAEKVRLIDWLSKP